MTSIESQFDRRLLFDHPDPYPLFAMLRQSQPVLATTHEGRPTFLLTKYDDCLAALQDAETYSSRSNAEAGQVLGRTVLEMDGHEHGRYRALVQPAFVPQGPRRAAATAGEPRRRAARRRPARNRAPTS